MYIQLYLYIYMYLYIRIIYSDSVIHTYIYMYHRLGSMYKYIYLFVYVIICLFIYFSLLDMNWNWITYIHPVLHWFSDCLLLIFPDNLPLSATSPRILIFWPSLSYTNTKPLSAAGDLAQDPSSPRPGASKSSPTMAPTQTRRPALLPTAATRW